MTYRIMLLVPVVVAMAAQGSAQEPEFRTRGGLVSEEVAREKLTHYGVTGIQSLLETGGVYEIHATHEGRPVRLQMNERTGVLREAGQLLSLTPAREAFQFVPRVDPGTANRLDQVLRFEQRSELDKRSLAHEHVHPEVATPR
jgi:hypothetical protein